MCTRALHGRARCVPDQTVTDGVSGALAITNNHALTWATAAQEAAGRSRSQGFGAYEDDGLETVDLSWRTCHISASYLLWAGDKPGIQMREPTYFVLASLLDGPLHGYAIIQRTEQLSGGRIKLATGTLYTALDRLTAEGHVELVREEIVNGRARRSYGLTPPGAGALRAEASRMAEAARLVTDHGRGLKEVRGARKASPA